MSDNLSGLPKFPGDESGRYEEALHRQPELPDSLGDRLRHAWPVYAAIAGLLGVWAIVAAALILAAPDWGTVVVVVVIPLLAAVWIAMRLSIRRRLRGRDD